MKSQQTVFRLTLSSSPHSVTRVEPYLKKISAALHLDDIQLNKLMVSVTEAVNNAIVHGNKLDAARKVRVVSRFVDDTLVIEVFDEGSGFDPRKIRSPLKKANLLKASGRGVFLMRTLMDSVEVSRGADGTCVSLRLRLTP